ncbi:hypothetical protein Y032_0035g3043 [Ancylostoma ceylanicum]|uniref:Secreted protein n=1 Tax=Ancylostoma ceylanicum TaxID=53326 RepID=A0A016ULY1_9BILA|nr:hypothetical protein Y032_0035g3043 [Ancylostoma ceylanicum]
MRPFHIQGASITIALHSVLAAPHHSLTHVDSRFRYKISVCVTTYQRGLTSDVAWATQRKAILNDASCKSSSKFGVIN